MVISESADRVREEGRQIGRRAPRDVNAVRRLGDDFDLLHLCDWRIGIDCHRSTAIGIAFVAVKHQEA